MEIIFFHARFRGILFEVKVNHKAIIINNLSEKNLTITVSGKEYRIDGKGRRLWKKEIMK